MNQKGLLLKKKKQKPNIIFQYENVDRIEVVSIAKVSQIRNFLVF